MIDFTALSAALENPTAFSVFYSFLLSFVLGSTIAIGYIKSFRGLSYSRNFLHCLVLFPILMSVAMQAIGDNIARGRCAAVESFRDSRPTGPPKRR